MEILKLKPVGKNYLWGGNRLNTEFHKNISMSPLAETWECSVHLDGPSYIINGDNKGMSLIDVLKEHPEYLGFKMNDKQFPILVKFIDAKEKLSVQVHPTDVYARVNEHDNGKTEMWYIIDAEPDAKLVYGFNQNMSPTLIRTAVKKGVLERYLNFISVKKGDCVFVPAGVVHAIGKGILIAEIQESSNVTYRLYDYNRIDKDGKKRELNVDKALNVIDMKDASNLLKKFKVTKYYPYVCVQSLVQCKYFNVEKIIIRKDFCFNVQDDSFQVVVCIDGCAEISSQDKEKHSVTFRKGDTMFLPANIGICTIRGDAEIIKIHC